MTNGASRLITAKVAANTWSAERASVDNGNVEKGSGSNGLEVRSRASAIARFRGCMSFYNVPNEKFTGSYQNMWVECFNHVVAADRTKLLSANRLHWLVQDGSPTSWPVANFNTFMAAAKKYWES
jgi:hypothetical protein